jgi:predicted metal-dependent peptidase
MESVTTEAEFLLSRSAVKLLRPEPFYAHIFAGLTRVIGDKVPTMAVSYNDVAFTLWVNPTFISEKLNELERVAVLKHELLHLVFSHLFRGKGVFPKIENIAADLVVNQYVDPWPLPEGAILISSFPDLCLTKQESFEYYYNKLLELKKEDAAEKYPKSYELFQKLNSEDESHQTSSCIGSHELWSKKDEESVHSEKALRALKNILKSAQEKTDAKFWGSLPAGIRREIEGMLAPPKISWKHVVKLFNSACGKTVLRTTRRKESRRFEGSPGVRIKRLRKIVVAIDTSGSINNTLFQEFWNEIMAISKTGTLVTVVECDAEIHHVYDVRNQMAMPKPRGGGGTSFDPVLRWVKRHRMYNGLIYFTDAYANEPRESVSLPVLWCVYGGIEKTDHLPGKVIRVE